MATFTPQPIATTIAATTKFSEYRNKIQQSMDDFGTNVNAALVDTTEQLTSEVVSEVESNVNSKLASYVTSNALSYTVDEIDTDRSATNKASFIANGHTAEPKEYIETNTPYTMIDPSTDSLIVDGNVVEVVGEELVTNPFTLGVGWSEIDGRITNDSGVLYSRTYTVITATSGSVLKCEIFCDLPAGEHRLYIGSAVLATDKSYILQNGINSFELIATVDINYLWIQTNTSNTGAIFDNISVKEIQPIELPLAPFDPASTDEVLDDKVNGLNTQMAHNKGDIVVAGAERVVNGGFDTDVLSWPQRNGLTLERETTVFTDGGLKQTLSSTYGWGYQGIQTTIGKEYSVNFSFNIGTSSATSFKMGEDYFGTTIVATKSLSASGNYTLVFTATTSTTFILLNVNGVAGQYNIYDNISVTLKDDVYQASVDTVDMYDYTTALDDGTFDPSEGIVIYHDGTNTNSGIAGHFYLAIQSWANSNPSNTSAFDNILYYTDLGTASTMSLQNPYFNVLPRVARQDVVVHRVNKSTLAYDKYSFKGTHLFEDTADSIEIMDYYYGSADDKGLWSDATYWYLPLDCFERLNSGSYHPWFNEFGAARVGKVEDIATNGYLWYYPSGGVPPMTSSYGAFVRTANGGYLVDVGASGDGSIGGIVARPNSEFYDKVYKNQSRDLRLKAYEEDDTTLLRKKASENESGRLDGVEGVVEVTAEVNVVETNTTTTSANINVTDWTKYTVGGTIAVITSAGIKFYGEVISRSSGGYITLSESISRVNGEVYLSIIIYGKSPHSFRSEYTMTDLIGDPANYPQTLKSRLASGKGVLVNPLLVGQDGTSYIPDGLDKDYISSKKWVSGGSRIAYTPSTDTYGQADDSNRNPITNAIEGGTSTDTIDRVTLFPYQAKTNSTKSLPMGTTEATLDKYYASNSHSIYKGGTAVASGTGKIPTGNGSNGFESGYLGDCEVVLGKDEINVGTIINAYVDDVYLIKGDGGLTDTPSFGRLYKRINSDLLAYTVVTTTGFSASANWEEVYETTQTHIGSTPSHQTITLDTEDSIASKRFYTLEVDSNNQKQLVQYTTELVSQAGIYGDTGAFTQLTDGTSTDWNSNTIITSRTATKLNSFKGDN